MPVSHPLPARAAAGDRAAGRDDRRVLKGPRHVSG